MKRIDDQYPEYAHQVQSLLASRLCLNLEMEGYRRLGEMNVIPEKVVEEMRADVEQRMEEVRHIPRSALRFDVADLLRSVPFFHDVPAGCIEDLARRARQYQVLEDEVVFREGDTSDTLYLIARGAIRISVRDPARILAVLGPGDFFGEIALLTARPRTATASAVTPANLVELRRRDVDEIESQVPELRQALESAFRDRLLDQWMARHPLFADLNQMQRAAFASYFRATALDPGERLSIPEPVLLLVRSGEVQVRGRTVKEGELSGVELFTGAAAGPGPISAGDRAELFLFGPAELEALGAESPDILALVNRRAKKAVSV